VILSRIRRKSSCVHRIKASRLGDLPDVEKTEMGRKPGRYGDKPISLQAAPSLKFQGNLTVTPKKPLKT
jgi:hypothetical protein